MYTIACNCYTYPWLGQVVMMMVVVMVMMMQRVHIHVERRATGRRRRAFGKFGIAGRFDWMVAVAVGSTGHTWRLLAASAAHSTVLQNRDRLTQFQVARLLAQVWTKRVTLDPNRPQRILHNFEKLGSKFPIASISTARHTREMKNSVF